MNQLLLLASVVVLFVGAQGSRTNFAVVFGDSLSDTGNFDSVYPNTLRPPYNAGRFTNGQVMMEYAIKELNIAGSLSPYLWSITTDYSHGINFAFGGATATQEYGLSFPQAAPFYLGTQLNKFMRFKNIVNTTIYDYQLPNKAQLQNALYFIFSGGNDINYANFFTNRTESEFTSEVIPNVVNTIVGAVQQLSSLGAKRIVVVNMPPQGCCPFYLANYYAREGNVSGGYDQYGCSIKFQRRAEEYNAALKSGLLSINNTSTQVILADYFNAAMELYINPTKYGLAEETKFRACCGASPNGNNCATVSLFSCGGCTEDTMCKNPDQYFSWDGIHYTDAFNKQLARLIFRGCEGRTFLNPPYALDDMIY